MVNRFVPKWLHSRLLDSGFAIVLVRTETRKVIWANPTALRFGAVIGERLIAELAPQHEPLYRSALARLKSAGYSGMLTMLLRSRGGVWGVWRAEAGRVTKKYHYIVATVSHPAPGSLQPLPNTLTKTELLIAADIHCGLSTKDIASRRGMSERTVSNHRYSIRHKLPNGTTRAGLEVLLRFFEFRDRY